MGGRWLATAGLCLATVNGLVTAPARVEYRLRGSPQAEGHLPPEVEVSFHAAALGHTPSTHILYLQRGAQSVGATLHVHDAHGEHVSEALSRTYRSGAATFTLNRDGTAHALFHHTATNTTYALDPLRHYLRHQVDQETEHLLTGEHDHVVYAANDIATTQSYSPQDVARGSMSRWDNCYPGSDEPEPRHVVLGVAVDYGAFLSMGSVDAVKAEVDRWVGIANMAFESQLGVQIVVGKYDVRTVSSGAQWNVGPEYDQSGNLQACATSHTAEDRLTMFSEWAKDTPSAEGPALWHLVTACYPGDTSVGIAWTGVLCEPGYNAGMSKFMYMGWSVFTHELGHNFGGLHTFQEGEGTTGGILDYGDDRYQGWLRFHSQYNKQEMCGHIRDTLSGRGECLKEGWPNRPQPVNPRCADEIDCQYYPVGLCPGYAAVRMSCPLKCSVCSPDGSDPLDSTPGADRDCLLSNYYPWETCGTTCDGGTQMRFRSILQSQKGNGLPCQPPLAETRSCFSTPCDSPPVPSCAADVEGEWPAAESNVTVVLGCVDGSAGEKARTCAMDGTWNAVSNDSCAEPAVVPCPADRGYPVSHEGEVVSLECGDGALDRGMTSRECSANGAWRGIDCSQCVDDTLLVAAAAVGGAVLLLCVLAVACWACRSRKKLAATAVSVGIAGEVPADASSPVYIHMSDDVQLAHPQQPNAVLR